MIVKDSTADLDQGEVDNPMITLLGRHVGFNFKRSVKSQLEIARRYPNSPDFKETLGGTSAVKGDSIPVQEYISGLSRVNQTYGLTQNQKYSGKTQSWDGYVIDINKDHFVARLEDMTNPGTHEIMTFDLDDVSPEDESLLSIGSTFYFSVGYVLNNGQREKTSLLRFKRIVEWTDEEFDRAIDRAEKISKKLKWISWQRKLTIRLSTSLKSP
jgi:hypothetical protein